MNLQEFFHFNWTWVLPSGYNQVKMLLKRVDMTDKGVFGQLTLDNGSKFSCVTLERHDIDIPVGEYKVTLYESPVHGLVPLLQDVPGRSMIEMHEGNWEDDSKGCILVGACRDALDKTMIDNSVATKKALLVELQGKGDLSIVIS